MTRSPEYRALVVDDDVTMQRLLAFALRQKGFRCDLATDGQEAERQVVRVPYDAVVVTLAATNNDGRALTAHLLMLTERPVIVAYGCAIAPRLAGRLLAQGVDEVALPPLDVDLLAAKVRTLVERKHPMQDPMDVPLQAVGASLLDVGSLSRASGCEALRIFRNNALPGYCD